MPNKTTLTFSLTETKQFQRLVAFLMDIESLARINADDELHGLVDECREDLLSFTIGDTDDD